MTAPHKPAGKQIDWVFGKQDSSLYVFVTLEPDGEYYVWSRSKLTGKPDWTYSFKSKKNALREMQRLAGYSGPARGWEEDLNQNGSPHSPNAARRGKDWGPDRPLAVKGLTSYRYRGHYNWIMIGAKDDDDALREAARSHSGATSRANLQVWDGDQYVPVLTPNARREDPDTTAARELSLYIENEYSLVGAPNSQGKAIEKNLLSKIRKGTFDLEKSEQAWMYLMEAGAKKYAKEFGDGESAWARMFNKPTRELVAHEFATTFYEENKGSR